MDRRRFLGLAAFAPVPVLTGCRAGPRPRRSLSIASEVLWNGRGGEAIWFHPRPCLVPGGVLMTMQSISGSDYYGPVFWTRSDDHGRSWRTPRPIPALGRRDVGGGYHEGACDVVPQFHERTGTVLALGHNVFYRGGRLARPQRNRFPVYVTGDGRGAWSDRRSIEWRHPDADRIYTCGCAERLTLDNGDILIPISFGNHRRDDRAVMSMRCSFDGERLVVCETGNALGLAVRRGLLEPSICRFDGVFRMTIRAEDGRGYSSISRDGLQWSPIRSWRFDDDEELVMSTTQQHWIASPDGLYLVYSRRDASNDRVMRYRAPLYVAEVEPGTMRLRRDTERVVLPLRGDPRNAPKDVARMGNFHTLVVSDDEAWVTVGEARPTVQWRGDVLLSRLRWGSQRR